jgi:ribonuclease P/MRP protein subunit POP5
MVRLKTRYLLFEILYPDSLPVDLRSSSLVENGINLRQVSDKKLDGRTMNRLLRQTIEMNFGEYGIGLVANTIAGEYSTTLVYPC